MNCKGIELFLELSPKTKYWSLAQVWNREEKVCCSVCFSHNRLRTDVAAWNCNFLRSAIVAVFRKDGLQKITESKE